MPNPFDTKKIPSLSEWLGDGTRADGYEEWARDLLFIDQKTASPEQKIGLRMVRTLTVACMETMRQEAAAGDVSSAEALRCLARAAGIAVGAPILSMVRDDAENLGTLAQLLADEFLCGVALLLPERAAKGGAR